MVSYKNPIHLFSVSGLEPPERLLVHSHWTIDDRKMSKSLNNVVDPHVAAEQYTYEGLRYFLLRQGTAHSDGSKCLNQLVSNNNKTQFYFISILDYTEVKISRIINAELVNTLGNLLSRICGKRVNGDQVIPALDIEPLKQYDGCLKLIEKLHHLSDLCETHYDTCNFYMAVDEILATLHATNGILQETTFWTLAKDPTDARTLNAILALAFESLRICSILLQPIIPNMAERILTTLNVEQRTWDDAKLRYEDTTRDLYWANQILMAPIK